MYLYTLVKIIKFDLLYIKYLDKTINYFYYKLIAHATLDNLSNIWISLMSVKLKSSVIIVFYYNFKHQIYIN